MPTQILEIPGQTEAQKFSVSSNTLLPDWSQISFSSMPPIAESGRIDASQYVHSAEYDLTRSWSKGQTPDEFLQLGDLSQALQPELLSVEAIAQLTGQNLSESALSSFPLAGNQTLSQLTQAVPTLSQFEVKEVAPVNELLSSQGLNVPDQVLGSVLAQHPQAAQLLLSSVDLSKYPISSIPNLGGTQLSGLSGWHNSLIKDIPGLNALPLSSFPTPVAALDGTVMRIDSIYGSAETERTNTISGSDVEGFQVRCGKPDKDCAYIELDDLENTGRSARRDLEGKQWISGKYQEVEGGHGCLKFVNGGKEPTGRLPFGSAFKVVVMEPDETTDTVTTALYFRFTTFCGASPYLIGPVPFFTYKRDSSIFVGMLQGGEPKGFSTPTGANPGEAVPFTGDPNLAGGSLPCPPGTAEAAAVKSAGTVQGVNLDTLAQSIAGIESDGSYTIVGPYVCADGGQNCGRPLGKYQYMSYNHYAINAIASKLGGTAFLSKLRGGVSPTAVEMNKYFPPADQEAAFRQDLANKLNATSRQIDPTTGNPFTGDRLIERVAQKHFGGDASKVDGGSSEVFGRLTLKTYGQDALKRYKAGGGSRPIGGGIISSAGANCSPTAAEAPVTPGDGNATGKYINPASGYPITSEMGHRHSPCSGCSSYHKGIDLGTPTGTPIKAADGGTVVYSGTARGYGNVVIINHGGGRQTRYAHLSAMDVPVGTKVSQGQVIGKAGSTGVGTGAHLHFEIRTGAVAGQPFSGTALNPRQFVKF